MDKLSNNFKTKNAVIERADPYDSFPSAFHHVFIERRLLVVIAFVSGFILGGSLLLTLSAHLMTAAHMNAYSSIVSLTSEAIILLRFFWLLGELAYRDFKAKRLTSFLELFMVAFAFSLCLPVFILVGIVQTVRVDVLGSARVRDKTSYNSRFTSLFYRMAHIN